MYLDIVEYTQKEQAKNPRGAQGNYNVLKHVKLAQVFKLLQ